MREGGPDPAELGLSEKERMAGADNVLRMAEEGEGQMHRAKREAWLNQVLKDHEKGPEQKPKTAEKKPPEAQVAA